MNASHRKLLIGSVLVLTVVVIGSSILARGLFVRTLDSHAADVLDESWAAMRGYLRIEGVGNEPVAALWYYDSEDPDESSIVGRLRRAFLVTDSSGTKVLSISRTYENIGKEPPALIQSRVSAALAPSGRKAFYDTRYSDGVFYLVRAGVIFDEQRRNPYYVAIGTPLAASRRTLNIFTLILVAALASAILLGCAVDRTITRATA
jgi:hypothetical protein